MPDIYLHTSAKHLTFSYSFKPTSSPLLLETAVNSHNPSHHKADTEIEANLRKKGVEVEGMCTGRCKQVFSLSNLRQLNPPVRLTEVSIQEKFLFLNTHT